MIRLKATISCDHCKKSTECTCSVEGSIGRGGSVEITIDPDVTGWRNSYGVDYCPTCVELLRLDR
jgi:hypothetical protein